MTANWPPKTPDGPTAQVVLDGISVSNFSLLKTLPGDTSQAAAEGLLRIKAGTLIDGVYRVIGPLGSGSMGVVLLAEDESLDRRVAIKFVHSTLHRHDFIERFTAEARALARVSHPNVLQIYAFGEHDGAPYFATEFVEGQTLEQWLVRSGAHPDIEVALDILDGVCDGVAAIHSADTVHRDLKPGNVLLDTKLRPHIADLGLAMLCRDDVATGPEVVGTPAYMAPEIAFATDFAPAPAALADVYSLGCMTYELLTAHPPFEAERHGGSPVGLILQHRIGTVVAPSIARPGLPRAFDDVILHALAKDPADRTQSVDAFRRELMEARSSASSASVRILVADDHADFRDSLEIMLGLEFPGADIECVGDGTSALAAFDRKRPSVAILDLQMPGLDGMQLTGLIRQRDPMATVPILIMTASGGSREWERLAAMGADRFFVKPIVVEDVVGMVRQLLKPRTSNRPPRPLPDSAPPATSAV
jgi:serine/threonine protein kinase